MDVIKVKDRDELQKILDDDETYEQEYEEYEIQDENIGEDKIVTSGQPYFIEDLQLLVIEGEYCNHETEGGEDEFIPDWSLTLVYPWDPEKTIFDQEDVGDYVYFEQDPPIVSLHNYLWAISQQKSDK